MTPHPSDEARKLLNRTGGVLAVGSMVILGFLAVGLVFVEIPKANESMIFALVGGVIGMVTQANAFFFGSSHQAKVQAETIDTMARTSGQAGPSVVLHSGDTARTETQTKSETKVD